MQRVTRLPQNLPEHLVNVLVKLKRRKSSSEQHLLSDLIPYLAAVLILEISGSEIGWSPMAVIVRGPLNIRRVQIQPRKNNS